MNPPNPTNPLIAMDHVYAVIMAGGSGERFWPLSTPDCPKQFLRLLDEKSLLRGTRRAPKGGCPPSGSAAPEGNVGEK